MLLNIVRNWNTEQINFKAIVHDENKINKKVKPTALRWANSINNRVHCQLHPKKYPKSMNNFTGVTLDTYIFKGLLQLPLHFTLVSSLYSVVS